MEVQEIGDDGIAENANRVAHSIHRILLSMCTIEIAIAVIIAIAACMPVGACRMVLVAHASGRVASAAVLVVAHCIQTQDAKLVAIATSIFALACAWTVAIVCMVIRKVTVDCAVASSLCVGYVTTGELVLFFLATIRTIRGTQRGCLIRSAISAFRGMRCDAAIAAMAMFVYDTLSPFMPHPSAQ
jgi:hypothetical protein